MHKISKFKHDIHLLWVGLTVVDQNGGTNWRSSNLSNLAYSSRHEIQSYADIQNARQIISDDCLALLIYRVSED